MARDGALKRLLPIACTALGLAACGIPGTPSDLKYPGVGLDPDEIGEEPVETGGLVEYTWVEFAGGQLSLAAMGLLSFDEAGPSSGFKPPYAIINGTGFVFDTAVPRADAMFGSFAAPPKIVGTCETVFEPQAYLSNVADVGQTMTLRTADGSAGFDINRRPFVFPPVVQYVFPYYSELGSWRSVEWTHKAPTGQGSELSDMEDVVLARPNYPFGEEVFLDFPGGVPPVEATYASVPMPLASVGSDTSLTLPQQPQGFVLEWTGPRFDPKTRSWVEDGNTHTQCLRFQDSEASLGIDEDGSAGDGELLSPEDCIGVPTPPTSSDLYGQIYTPPWKTSDGLTLRWEPDTTSTDTLSISVRFLGAIDETDYYFVEDRVFVEPDGSIGADWDDYVDDGDIPEGTPVPTGMRESLACDPEEDVNWVFDPAFKQGDGSYIPSLQGDPLHTMVEVTCTIDPAAGEFTLTNDVLGTALSFADQYQAAGAVFYVARTQTSNITTPPVRDNFGNRRDIPPVTVVGKAVQVGRFWYDR